MDNKEVIGRIDEISDMISKCLRNLNEVEEIRSKLGDMRVELEEKKTKILKEEFDKIVEED